MLYLQLVMRYDIVCWSLSCSIDSMFSHIALKLQIVNQHQTTQNIYNVIGLLIELTYINYNVATVHTLWYHSTVKCHQYSTTLQMKATPYQHAFKAIHIYTPKLCTLQTHFCEIKIKLYILFFTKFYNSLKLSSNCVCTQYICHLKLFFIFIIHVTRIYFDYQWNTKYINFVNSIYSLNTLIQQSKHWSTYAWKFILSQNMSHKHYDIFCVLFYIQTYVIFYYLLVLYRTIPIVKYYIRFCPPLISLWPPSHKGYIKILLCYYDIFCVLFYIQVYVIFYLLVLYCTIPIVKYYIRLYVRQHTECVIMLLTEVLWCINCDAFLLHV